MSKYQEISKLLLRISNVREEIAVLKKQQPRQICKVVKLNSNRQKFYKIDENIKGLKSDLMRHNELISRFHKLSEDIKKISACWGKTDRNTLNIKY